MNKEKQIEKDELFGILSNTINGANFDDLSEAVYKISDVAGYRKQSEGEWLDNDDMYKADMLNYRCSICGNYEYLKENFCSNCGAKMKGDSDAR